MSASIEHESDTPYSDLVSCPTCGLPFNSTGQPCPRCGSSMLRGPDTLQVDFRSLVSEYAKQLRGEAFIAHPNAITFEINGLSFVLPEGDMLIVGRSAKVEDPVQPDVDLTQFSAAQAGVSRTHMRLIRRGNLIYMADMESRNGTWLNGKRLTGNGERLLRDGDLVQLGKLKITLRFGPQ